MFVTLVQDLEDGQKQTPLGSLDTGLEMASDGMRVDNLEPEAWADDLDLEEDDLDIEADDLDLEVDDLDLEAEADDLDLEVDDLDLEAEADDLDLEVDDLGQDDRDHEAKSAWEKM